jgi:hypothetical protein
MLGRIAVARRSARRLVDGLTLSEWFGIALLAASVGLMTLWIFWVWPEG